MMKLTTEKSKIELASFLINTDSSEVLKTQLKNIFSDCSRANINTKPLSNLLSTIYADLAVAKGLLAMNKGCVFKTPSQKSAYLQRQELIFDHIYFLTEIFGDLSQNFPVRETR